MSEQTPRKFQPIYLLTIGYAAAVYLFPVLWLLLNKDTPDPGDEGKITPSMILPLLIPGVLGLVNLITVIVRWKQLDRETLLHCAVIIKYALVPFFIVGGCCIALMWALTFSPVVIMIFIGPVIVAIFSVLGYISMLGSAPYSIGYLIRSGKEQVHPPWMCIAGGVMQLFFTLDTISVMLLALKEKKCIKATIVMAALLVLAFLVFAIGIVLLILDISKSG